MFLKQELLAITADNWLEKIQSIDWKRGIAPDEWDTFFDVMKRIAGYVGHMNHPALHHVMYRAKTGFKAFNDWAPFFNNDSCACEALRTITYENRLATLRTLSGADLTTPKDWAVFFTEMGRLRACAKSTQSYTGQVEMLREWYRIAARVYPAFELPISAQINLFARTQAVWATLEADDVFQAAVQSYDRCPTPDSQAKLARQMARAMTAFYPFFSDVNMAQRPLKSAAAKEVATLYAAFTQGMQTYPDFETEWQGACQRTYDVTFRQILKEAAKAPLSLSEIDELFETAAERKHLRRAYVRQPAYREAAVAKQLMCLFMPHCLVCRRGGQFKGGHPIEQHHRQ